jgi:tRNA pseudouridine55 synthase
LIEGIILLDKPPGLTSFQSLGEVKRRLATRRVGHAGTLDKFAEGLLVVLAGRMTRLCAYATTLDKEYVAVITFGRGTDTLDPEGAVTGKGRIPDRDQIEAVMPAFRGTFQQLPPAYSAVHIGGRRAYEAARSGEEVVLAPRVVTIEKLELLDYTPPEATLRVSCSKGTYIRALARDMAERLGTFAHVSRLCRTRIGGFLQKDAKRPDQFDPQTDLLPPSSFFDAAPDLKRLRIRETWAERVGNGFPLVESCFESVPEGNGIFGAFTVTGRLVAMVERLEGVWRYAATFPEERPERRQERQESRQERSECRQERQV